MPNSFSFHAIVRGGHTHVKVRTGAVGCARGYNGMLMFRNEEWSELRAALLAMQQKGQLAVEIDETPENWTAIEGEEP